MGLVDVAETYKCCKRGKMIKSTLWLVILLIVLAEGSFKNRFSHIRYAITPGGGRSGRSLPQNCEGRLEFILSPSNKGAELKTVGKKREILAQVQGNLTRQNPMEIVAGFCIQGNIIEDAK